MKKSGFYLLLCLSVLACADAKKEPQPKELREIMHLEENHFSMDTLWSDGKKEVDFTMKLNPIPNYFVVAHTETDSFVEAHFFQDLSLLLQVNSDSFIIHKDSLLPFVNDAYLKEALIEDVQLMAFEPENDYYLFEFAVRKPHEDFKFHFIGSLSNKTLLLNIDDE